MHWYLAAWKKYADFSGRSRRREYWIFTLFNTLAMLVLAFVDSMTGAFSRDAGIGVLSGIYGLAVFIPGLAVLVRRLHDTGKSAWWCLILLIPLIGPIVILVFSVTAGDAGDNAYGPDPKASPSP